MRVLLVEDEPRLSATLSKGLSAEGFVVVAASTGVEGLHEAIANGFDVVVLDIMLPGYSGYEVLRRMRTHGVWTPVLMLTAKDGEFDETDAFDLGADDYLTKPFSFRVLVARLRALMRRGARERPAVLTAGSLSLDPARHTVQRGSTPITLTPREYGLLEFLMRNAVSARRVRRLSSTLLPLGHTGLRVLRFTTDHRLISSWANRFQPRTPSGEASRVRAIKFNSEDIR